MELEVDEADAVAELGAYLLDVALLESALFEGRCVLHAVDLGYGLAVVDLRLDSVAEDLKVRFVEIYQIFALQGRDVEDSADVVVAVPDVHVRSRSYR